MDEHPSNRSKPTVLYLSMIGKSPSHEGKLAGVRRYCSLRGWEVVPVFRNDVTPATLPDILRRHRPLGCVVEGVGRHADFPPRLFRGMPVSYIGYPRGRTGPFANFHFDAAAIAEAALRELSAGMPSCYAAIGSVPPQPWSRIRVRAFRDAVQTSGGKCFQFSAKPRNAGESADGFVERMVPWLAALPEHCAVFVVSDETAMHVVRAARIAGRHIPRSLTLVSVDNFAELCESADPPISSIQLDFEREGFLAARALGVSLASSGAGKHKGAGASGAAAAGNPIFVGPLMVARRKSTSGHGRHEKFILDAVGIIRREACDGLGVRALLARFPQSRRLFELRFREAMGHSVLDEILHVRLEKAFTLLAQTDTAVGAVPALCGFRCARTLDALFRSRCGMSMSEWRRRNRG